MTDSKQKKDTKQPQKTKKTSENKYRSKLESQVAQDLENKKVSYMYEWDWIDYTVTRKYRPDFLLPNQIHVEVKGYFRSADQRKHRAIKRQHPKLDIRFVFENSRRKLRKGAKSTYGEWCYKYGLLYSNRVIPEEWLKEKGKNKHKKFIAFTGTKRRIV